MLNNTQSVQTEIVDKRFLPDKGIICLWKIAEYVGIPNYRREEYIADLVESFTENNIPVIRVSNNQADWLVCLHDIKTLNKSATEYLRETNVNSEK